MSFRTALLLSAAVLLPGCTSLHVMSHVPLSTLSRLSSLKLAEIDPAALRVAARLPERLEPRKDGVKVRIAVAASRQAKRTNDEFVLEPVTEAHELAALAGYRRNGTRLWTYRLSPHDAARLQGIIASSMATSAGGRVTVAAGVDACHRGPLGSEPLPTTTFLRTSMSGYMILAENLDLRSVVSARELATMVPACT